MVMAVRKANLTLCSVLNCLSKCIFRFIWTLVLKIIQSIPKTCGNLGNRPNNTLFNFDIVEDKHFCSLIIISFQSSDASSASLASLVHSQMHLQMQISLEPKPPGTAPGSEANLTQWLSVVLPF